MSSDLSALLSAEKVATLLGISLGTLAKWRMAGRGPRFVKLGRRVGYRVPDVSAWMDQNTRGGGR